MMMVMMPRMMSYTILVFHSTNLQWPFLRNTLSLWPIFLVLAIRRLQSPASVEVNKTIIFHHFRTIRGDQIGMKARTIHQSFSHRPGPGNRGLPD